MLVETELRTYIIVEPGSIRANVLESFHVFKNCFEHVFPLEKKDDTETHT
jgi:hypothetical protein